MFAADKARERSALENMLSLQSRFNLNRAVAGIHLLWRLTNDHTIDVAVQKGSCCTDEFSKLFV